MFYSVAAHETDTNLPASSEQDKYLNKKQKHLTPNKSDKIQFKINKHITIDQ